MLYIKKQPTPSKIHHAAQRMKTSERWLSIEEGDTKAVRDCFEHLEYYDDQEKRYIYAKGLIRAELLKEQHHLCAYCMTPIEDDGQKTKVEHFVPLSSSNDKALDYQNFLAVCKGGEKPHWQIQDTEVGERILCCEAVKGDHTELTIDPRNQDMMNHIAYYSNGEIYFEGLSDYPEDVCAKIRLDLDETLRLNGKINPDGSRQDTATRLVYNRKATYQATNDVLRRLRKEGKLTLSEIEHRIQTIINAEYMDAFAGVKLFILYREWNRLSKHL